MATILPIRRTTLKAGNILSHIVNEHFEDEVAFLQRLVRANSANLYTAETSSANDPVEAEVAAVICEEMHCFGWQPTLHGISEQRRNVLYVQPGKSEGKTLVLNAHMDTVPASADYTRDPWSAEIVDGRLYGLGSADAKAQIATFMYATLALGRVGIDLAGTIKIAFVCDEETGADSLFGTRFLLEQGLLDGDAAIVGEPGDSKIAIGHRGVYRFKIITHGESVHTGMKEWEKRTRGRNAVLDMSSIIQVLSSCSLPHKPSMAFPGRKSVLTFPTIISGGSGVNIVPGFCEAYGDVRLMPSLFSKDVREAIERCLAPLNIPYEMEDIVFVPAVETPPTAGIVQCLAQSIDEITGTLPRLEGAGPACDGWMLSTHGIETVCGYGVKCGGVHGADEWTDLDSLKTVTEVYAYTILKYLGQA